MRKTAFQHLCLLLIIFTMAVGGVYASHNLAGQITYRNLGNRRIEITVTTYTDPTAAGVDRCAIDLEIWNQSANVKLADLRNIYRVNGPNGPDPNSNTPCPVSSTPIGEYLFGSIKMNVYQTIYQFDNDGAYLVRFRDLARLDNITNITNSGQQAFFLEATININSLLDNNSPLFLNHPLDEACANKIYTHNPGGYDPDGDSLAYKLVACRQYDPPSIPTPIPCTNYQFPDQINPNGAFTMDPTTGEITWDTPQLIGIYNIAYIIEEWRNGVRIGFSFRDMAIFVDPCNNDPPVIESIDEVCVIAGDTLVFDFKAYDPNFPTDSIYFYLNNNGGGVNNGPFAVQSSPAELNFIPPYLDTLPYGHDDTIRGQVYWETNCSHVRKNFYQVDFYVHDNLEYFNISSGSSTMLSDNHVVKIRVIPPPVTGLTATVGGRQVTLNWDVHPCDNVIGYEIFRRIGSGFQQDSVCCDQSPKSAGFESLGYTIGRNDVTFIDDNNGSGINFTGEICYVVVALIELDFASCASEEVCVELKDDFPVLTNDSIEVTDIANGSVFISWSQPKEVDTAFFPQPYTYTLLRADNISGASAFTPIATGLPFDDTTYFDLGLNTVSLGYRYQVELYDGAGELISSSVPGSSVFLQGVISGDEQLTLNWSEYVPWENEIYYIWRSEGFAGPYQLIDSIPATNRNRHSYVDRGLENGQEYCYYILSKGDYASTHYKSPLLNASQKACGIPQDMEPPCIGAVIFDTASNCQNFSIRFDWEELLDSCLSDISFFSFYRADRPDGKYIFVANVSVEVDSFLLTDLTSIADCYAVTATDSAGNESDSLIYCFDNCPEFEPGNVFTPNGDRVNDFFNPFKNRSVIVREIKIFDRWGGLVFASTNLPNSSRLWNGMNNKQKEAPEGVYYYYIRYDEERLPGDITRPPLVGSVTLMR